VKIAKVIGREIFDSRGVPTVLCEMLLDDGTFVVASVPSGASRGKHEAFELRDHDDRLMGNGVSKAIHNVEYIIGPAIIGKEPDVAIIDEAIRELDPSVDKRKLGANATLAVSMAACRAQAAVNEIELFELIARLYDAESMSLPFPLFNVLNGGAHVNNGFPIQEIMLVPVGAQNFRVSFEAAVTVFYELKRLLDKDGKSTAVGDEGGFAPRFENDKEPFDFLMKAINNTGNESLFTIAIDVAASQLYDENTGKYNWNGQEKTSEDLLAFYKSLLEDYPLYSIEDGFAETDLDGWHTLFHELGGTLQIVGDDIFVTSVPAISKGLEQEVANAAIIKPNQIGTITETLEAISFCHENNMNAIVSHRSGETIDTFIADLAVGTSAGQIKAGGCSRGERIAKYNRLLLIEDILTMSLLDF
jgi:enolase